MIYCVLMSSLDDNANIIIDIMNVIFINVIDYIFRRVNGSVLTYIIVMEYLGILRP